MDYDVHGLLHLRRAIAHGGLGIWIRAVQGQRPSVEFAHQRNAVAATLSTRPARIYHSIDARVF